MSQKSTPMLEKYRELRLSTPAYERALSRHVVVHYGAVLDAMNNLQRLSASPMVVMPREDEAGLWISILAPHSSAKMENGAIQFDMAAGHPEMIASFHYQPLTDETKTRAIELEHPGLTIQEYMIANLAAGEDSPYYFGIQIGTAIVLQSLIDSGFELVLCHGLVDPDSKEEKCVRFHLRSESENLEVSALVYVPETRRVAATFSTFLTDHGLQPEQSDIEA